MLYAFFWVITPGNYPKESIQKNSMSIPKLKLGSNLYTVSKGKVHPIADREDPGRE